MLIYVIFSFYSKTICRVIHTRLKIRETGLDLDGIQKIWTCLEKCRFRVQLTEVQTEMENSKILGDFQDKMSACLFTKVYSIRILTI